RGRYATRVEHMPRAHRAHVEWTPSRLITWAEQTGPATGRFVAGLLARRPHPEQGDRACLGLMPLGAEHGTDRLEAACHRAEHLRSYRFRTVEHILRSQQDRLPLDAPPARPALTHENLRGATYYKEVYADPAHDSETARVASARHGPGLRAATRLRPARRLAFCRSLRPARRRRMDRPRATAADATRAERPAALSGLARGCRFHHAARPVQRRRPFKFELHHDDVAFG